MNQLSPQAGVSLAAPLATCHAPLLATFHFCDNDKDDEHFHMANGSCMPTTRPPLPPLEGAP